MTLAVLVLVAVPVVLPGVGAQVADTLRRIAGPDAVAGIESISFRIQDLYNRTHYQLGGAQSSITFASVPVVVPPTPTLATVPTGVPQMMPVNGPVPQNATRLPAVTAASISFTRLPAPILLPVPTPSPTPTSLPSVADAAPIVAGRWQPFGPSSSGRPIMARAASKPDPTRPYAQVALVRIDLSLIRLHFVLGTQEPMAAGSTTRLQRTGAIPQTDQVPNALIAAFNGGFKTIHGHYGVYDQGTTVVPLQNNLATLTIYQNGTVRIGAWGRDVAMVSGLVAARQNCPLLLDAGYINPDVNNGSRQEWGYTIGNFDATWRSGVGISQDGRFLVYAAGPSLTVESIARALQQAGAYYAMQLDINGYYTRFATYTPASTATGHPILANRLLNQMTVPSNLYLDSYVRDFFYITARLGQKVTWAQKPR